jgi:5'-nucleotidase
VRADPQHSSTTLQPRGIIVVVRIWPRVSALVAGVAMLATVLAAQSASVVDVQLLAINDFHGALEPPAGGNARIGTETAAGGMEYLATHLARLKATNRNTVIVSAGDNFGGTPLLSSLFHDEASVEALNIAGLDISAVGNHELDEGWWELYRMVKGGCHPTDGCQDGTPYDGAKFTYLSANITLDPAKADPAMLKLAGIRGKQVRPLFMPSVVKTFDGVRVGFIGLTVEDAPKIIAPASTVGLTFLPEAQAANATAKQLKQRGVHAIVVLTHNGGVLRGNDPDGCENLSRDMVDIVTAMSNDIDVVVSGHTHLAYNCTIGGKLLTSAGSVGRAITDIDIQIDRKSGKVVSKHAHNVIVSRDVDASAPEHALIARYKPIASKVGGRIVGAITATLPRTFNDAGESALGDVLADGMLDMAMTTAGANAEVAFMNPGGIRGDLAAMPGQSPSAVSYAQLFDVLPFGNVVMVKSVSGDLLIRLLEQQFDRDRILQVSSGFTYRYDRSRPSGQRVDRASVQINGVTVVPTQTYRVASIDFLWNGGDGFDVLTDAGDPVTVGTDVDVFAAYLTKHSPVAPGPQDRILKQR